MARTIYKREIPPQWYEGMVQAPSPGKMSFCFLKSETEVRIFTRDEMKKEWLLHSWGLGMGTWVNQISTPYSRFETDIDIIDMPRLFRISKENRKIAKEVSLAVQAARWNHPTDIYALEAARRDPVLSDAAREMLEELYNFCCNYSDNQYILDIAVRQFMETAEGNLILLDPVACRRLAATLWR